MEVADMHSRRHYDVPTAVTFLMAGLGIGSLLAILFSRPSRRPALSESGADRGASQWSSAS